jgi:hypothetical protein
MLIVSLLGTFNLMAQQQKNSVSAKNSADLRISNPATALYTYRVFEAPNKMFGYDIFQNGKGIFHQPAGIVSPNNTAFMRKENAQNAVSSGKQTPQNLILPKKENAENAALLSIEKIKKQMTPILTKEEMKKIVSQ